MRFDPAVWFLLSTGLCQIGMPVSAVFVTYSGKVQEPAQTPGFETSEGTGSTSIWVGSTCSLACFELYFRKGRSSFRDGSSSADTTANKQGWSNVEVTGMCLFQVIWVISEKFCLFELFVDYSAIFEGYIAHLTHSRVLAVFHFRIIIHHFWSFFLGIIAA